MSGLSSSALQDHLRRYGSRNSAGGSEDCSDASETGRGFVEHPIGQAKASEEEPSFLSMVFADGTSNGGTIADNVRFTVKGTLLFRRYLSTCLVSPASIQSNPMSTFILG